MSRAAIRRLAKQVRQSLKWTEPLFPIVEYMEVYHQIDKHFVYDICEKEVMGENHGITFPDKKIMLIREDVYEGAVEGNGRDRLTIAHEFGHLHMHTNLGLARKPAETEIPAFRSSEWQASCFGGELLVSVDHIHRCKDPWDAMQMFGVSLDAAEFQWRKFTEEGIAP
ncbi:MAG TPA: ImmA/IrrE family metallo-endopeptidase [Sedimenticola sp.]|nr:ImmA/IrrE family metallo-endopeptidase [Sedimenticola sp.]